MHYDLGTTYLELGLAEDAVREWSISAEHPSFRDAAHRMMDRVRGLRGKREMIVAPALIGAEVDRAFEDIFDLT